MKTERKGGAVWSTGLLGAFLLGALLSCAHFPTANYTVAVPPEAQDADLLELAIDAAGSVGLPPVTKLDKANRVIEFGPFGESVTGYAAQVRQRSDGDLEVTVIRGSVYVSRGADEKAREFVAALESRLRQYH